MSTLPTSRGSFGTSPSNATPRSAANSNLHGSDRPWVLLWAALGIVGICLFATVNALAESGKAGGDEAIQRADVFPLESRTDRMKVVSGADSGTSLDLKLEEADDGDAGWALRASGLNTLMLSEAGDGGVDVVSVELVDQQKSMTFNPPALYLPASLKPGESFERSGAVVIRNTSDGSVQTRGDYTQTVDPASRQSFELPIGTREGVEVTNTVEVETDWASVKLELITGYNGDMDNPGLIRRDMRTKITKAAFFGSTTERVLELAE